MKISILGDKVNVTTIIVILLVGMVICSFTACSCAGIEGFTPDSLIGSELGKSPNAKLLNYFQNSKFDPECCPATYSNSSGCLCDKDQLEFVNTRGGNRACCSSF
tara:strand:- start:335 stop:649 length:315 start_codon:yes stop_codon:yes gene_type:complete